MNPEQQVLHALGHHPWIYLAWDTGRDIWIHSFDRGNCPIRKFGNSDWPIRTCPICGLIQELDSTHTDYYDSTYIKNNPDNGRVIEWSRDVRDTANAIYHDTLAIAQKE